MELLLLVYHYYLVIRIRNLSVKLVKLSNLVPSCTAFITPKGIDIKYIKSVDGSPSDIDTGSFEIINSIAKAIA